MICECCGNDTDRTVIHHWYDRDGARQERVVCRACNAHLVTCNFKCYLSTMRTTLPVWGTQRRVVRHIRGVELLTVRQVNAMIPR